MAAGSSVQDQLLKMTVVGCYKLTNKEWFSRQDPYVVIEYSGQKVVTKTCTDGGRNPSFNESHQFALNDSVREINASVWNSNTILSDDYIGSTKISLKRVIESGYDDTQWSLTNNRSGKSSGVLNLILHFAGARTNPAQVAPAPVAPAPAGYPGQGAPPPPYGHGPPPYGAAVHPHYPLQQPHPAPFGGHGPPPSYMYQASPFPPQSVASAPPISPMYSFASATPMYPPAPATPMHPAAGYHQHRY